MDASLSSRIHVSNIDPNVTQQDLYSLFLAFGPISSITLPYDTKSLSNQYSNTNKANTNGSNHESNNSNNTPALKNKGHADIQFEFEDDALAAIDNMDAFEFFDRPIKVRKAIKAGKEGDASTVIRDSAAPELSENRSLIGQDGELLVNRKTAIWNQ